MVREAKRRTWLETSLSSAIGTALFADSDVTLSPTESQLRGDGVEVIQWPDAVATEDRACI